MPTHAAYHFNSSVQRVIYISDRCHVRFATMVDKKRGVRDDINTGGKPRNYHEIVLT